MASFKLPKGRVGSLSYLVFTGAVLYGTKDLETGSVEYIVSLILALFSFLLSIIDYPPLKRVFGHFYSDVKNTLPYPCKNNCDPHARLPICSRDIGFIIGISMATLLFIFYGHHQICSMQCSISMVVVTTALTLIHGTLRRHLGIFSNHIILTGVIGFITGFGIFFVATAYWVAKHT